MPEAIPDADKKLLDVIADIAAGFTASILMTRQFEEIINDLGNPPAELLTQYVHHKGLFSGCRHLLIKHLHRMPKEIGRITGRYIAIKIKNKDKVLAEIGIDQILKDLGVEPEPAPEPVDHHDSFSA